MSKGILAVYFLLATLSMNGQYWQQKVNYEMEINFDDENHQYEGEQTLTYYNNSPDTLYRLYFHLYNNAFKPGSLMAIKGDRKSDPSKGIKSIQEYNDDEIGYLNIKEVKQNGADLVFDERGTIMLLELAKPLLPKKKTVLNMKYDGQVPIQTRRSGRYNKGGVAYSMAQWYPKLCEYDQSGWHADPYVGREFYGVWGDYDVKISINKDFVLGGSGEVINGKTVKNGYGGYEGKPDGERVTWHFKAKNVHDFMWAADKDYIHKIVPINDELNFHLLYKNDSAYARNWEELATYLPRMVSFINKRFGKYAYSTFSIIQGGDRGMEYPTATLITGNRPLSSLVGVTAHEYMHAYYYFALGTNENSYPWMDEGFASYTDRIITNYLLRNDSISIPDFSKTQARVLALNKSERNELLSTHSNHYRSEVAYSINAYNKGALYLHQLAYVIGQDKLDATLLRYFNDWNTKHPGPEDFLLVAEKVSGLELDWYNDNYVRSFNEVDYGINSIISTSDETRISLERIGDFIMPVDLLVSLKNGEQHMYTIPLKIMWGHKGNQEFEHFYPMSPWPFVQKEYSLTLPFGVDEIHSLSIDPLQMTTDVNRENNDVIFDTEEDTQLLFKQ